MILHYFELSNRYCSPHFYSLLFYLISHIKIYKRTYNFSNTVVLFKCETITIERIIKEYFIFLFHKKKTLNYKSANYNNITRIMY